MKESYNYGEGADHIKEQLPHVDADWIYSVIFYECGYLVAEDVYKETGDYMVAIGFKPWGISQDEFWLSHSLTELEKQSPGSIEEIILLSDSIYSQIKSEIKEQGYMVF